MSDANKALVRRSIEELWSNGNLSVAHEFFSDNYTHHDPSTPDFGRGPEGETKRAAFYRTAFPDLRFTIEDILSEGETVTCRWSSRGTHRGPLSGIAPSGKEVTVTGMTFNRIAEGKIVEGWVSWDALGLLQQLGVVPVMIKPIADDSRPQAHWSVGGKS
jgi:steroid delta-isomerase-like uncharacterized protein